MMCVLGKPEGCIHVRSNGLLSLSLSLHANITLHVYYGDDYVKGKNLISSDKPSSCVFVSPSPGLV
jgi:hypothetical protein